MASSRARLGAYVATAFGVAASMPKGQPGPLAFALSPAGLAMVALVASLGGEAVEETGTLRRIRKGIALRLVGAALAFAAVGWAFVSGGELAAIGEVLEAIGLAGVGWFGYGDARVLGDLRHGQRVSLRDIGERYLEIRAGGAAVRVPLVALAGVAITTARRGLLIAVEHDAKIDGPAGALPWIEERLRSRAFFLDEHQLGGDARDLAERIGAAKSREPGGYR